MKSVFKPLLLAGVLATAGLAAFSQTPPMGDHSGMMGAGGPMHEGMEMSHPGMSKMDPAKMQARMEKRQAALKAALKLTPAQEGAWSTFTAALKPPADMMSKHHDHAEIAKLPTPERIDKMKALHAQHVAEMNAVMDKRGEASKAFYATLTPEQQKVFDTATARFYGPAGHMGGPREGKGPAQPKP
jgi:Spy/CpxP family protein refolding chaperone